jgi:arginyl-tRNA---protein transferase
MFWFIVSRGWRRSGTWLYKPNMEEICCRPYTIRLEAERFRANKDQKR